MPAARIRHSGAGRILAGGWLCSTLRWALLASSTAGGTRADEECRVRRRKDPRRRLSQLRAETERLRQRLAVLDEQLAYQQLLAEGDVDDGTVSAMPLAAREERKAGEDARRTRREREEVVERLRKVSAEQDELLERLAERATPQRGSDT